MKTGELFDVNRSIAVGLMKRHEDPVRIIGEIGDFIASVSHMLKSHGFEEILPSVWAARGTVISHTASITGPCIIDEGAQVRHCAFIRGVVIVGKGCVVGNSTELKNCILMDASQVPHYNYVGDSIIGYKAHMGAGAITSNVKSDKSDVCIIVDGERVCTNRRKLGALVGDRVEIGCGSVLCPGTVIGRGSTVYPLTLVRGTVPAGVIYKHDGTVTVKE